MALKGIRVLELAGLAPAPFCGMILSDFGATVIRIDKTSNSMVPDQLARGKKSVMINLKNKEGTNLMKQMCQKADVLIEPFRPGVMEKLGLGPEILLQTNPRLIYARLTGYGQTGIMANKAGHDINYIAMSGVLSKFGRKNERPYPPINVAADFAGGSAVCAIGILLSLYERSISGKGQVVDANMVEGSAYIACWIDAVKKLIFQQPRGTNMLDGGAAFYDTYETKDGKYVAIGALEPQFYKDLLKGLGLSNQDISQADDQEKQQKLFSDIIKTKSRDEWTKTFEHLDACFTPVLSSEEAAVHPHNADKGSFLQGTNPELMSGPAPRLSRTPEIREQRPLPEKGEHTMDVLLEMGFSQQDLKQLISNGAIGVNSKV